MSTALRILLNTCSGVSAYVGLYGSGLHTFLVLTFLHLLAASINFITNNITFL